MPALFSHPHLLGIEGLTAADILTILDEAEQWVAFNRGARKEDRRLAGLTQINAFFEGGQQFVNTFDGVAAFQQAGDNA